jgi:hypothetical protein
MGVVTTGWVKARGLTRKQINIVINHMVRDDFFRLPSNFLQFVETTKCKLGSKQALTAPGHVHLCKSINKGQKRYTQKYFKHAQP